MIKEPIRVWLVEDIEPYRSTVRRAFDKLDGLTCTADFSSMEQMLNELKAVPEVVRPSVVLLDVGLPGMSGLEGITKIHEVVPGVRVILLTVFDDDDKIFKAFCAGASGYLLKSCEVSEIGQAVYEVVEGGAPMTPVVAKRVLNLLSKHAPPAASAEYRLTDRERDVLELMVEGLTKKEIAHEANLSVHTVSTHLRHIYDKLHVNTNTAAVAKAIRENLV